jgi:hypothetical protein
MCIETDEVCVKAGPENKIDWMLPLEEKMAQLKEHRAATALVLGEKTVSEILFLYEQLYTRVSELGALRQENKQLREELEELVAAVKRLSFNKSFQKEVSTFRLQLGDVADEVSRLREDLLERPRWYHKLLFWRK